MFQIPKLRNDIYFDKKTVKPIFSKSHITESLNNLMLGVLDTNVRLEVTHRKYGVHTPDILVSLSNLFQSFSKDYKVYTGSQTLDDGRIQCVTVFHNQIYNYLHLLIVTATEGQYFDDKSVLDADFFSNIPQHNIKHLF